jgi:hypothetical protein
MGPRIMVRTIATTSPMVFIFLPNHAGVDWWHISWRSNGGTDSATCFFRLLALLLGFVMLRIKLFGLLVTWSACLYRCAKDVRIAGADHAPRHAPAIARPLALLPGDTEEGGAMKYLVVAGGRFHSDPPSPKCGVLMQTRNAVSWRWANEHLVDPIQWGRRAMKGKELRLPCLHCFPACKTREGRC